MQVINQAEFGALKFVARKVSEPHPVISAIRGLNRGQALVVTAQEWDRKNPPANYLSYKKAGAKYSARTLADKSGWAILRVE